MSAAAAFNLDEAVYAMLRQDDYREAVDRYRCDPDYCRAVNAWLRGLMRRRPFALRAARGLRTNLFDLKFKFGAWYDCDLCNASEYANATVIAKLAAELVRRLERHAEGIRYFNRCRTVKSRKTKLTKREWIKQKRKQQRSARVLASKVIRGTP
jgi:hypothetical protein